MYFYFNHIFQVGVQGITREKIMSRFNNITRGYSITIMDSMDRNDIPNEDF